MENFTPSDTAKMSPNSMKLRINMDIYSMPKSSAFGDSKTELTPSANLSASN